MIVIYKITNNVNGKSYIGITSRTIEERFNEHCSYKKSVISRAIKKYGKVNFTVSQLGMEDSFVDALVKETEYIKHFNTSVLNGQGYNVIENTTNGEFTHNMKISLIEGIKKSKNEKLSPRYINSSPFIGVYHNETSSWIYRIFFNKNNIIVKHFSSDKEAAIARDIKLLEIFDLKDSVRMMNFPENIDGYLNKDILTPERYLKISNKISQYSWVQYDKNQWRARIIPHNISIGMFLHEEEAAEMADYIRIKSNIPYDGLNFPDKLHNYLSGEYIPPKTVIERKKKCPYKNISFDHKGYRVYIEHGSIRYRPFYKTLKEAIDSRNNYLISIGRNIPND